MLIGCVCGLRLVFMGHEKDLKFKSFLNFKEKQKIFKKKKKKELFLAMMVFHREKNNTHKILQFNKIMIRFDPPILNDPDTILVRFY